MITLGSDSSIIANNGDIVLSNTGIITGATFGLTLDGTAPASSLASIIGTTSGTVTKNGTGTWMLSGANSYTGLTMINDGTLMLGAAGGATNTPLGTTDAGTIVASGATLDLNGFSLGTAEPLTLNGTGAGGAGALTNSSATAARYKGLITLDSDSSIIADNGLLTLNVASGNSISGTNNITFGGTGNITVADPIATGSSTLTKTGTGTLTLGMTNTYTGGTTINDGTLILGHLTNTLSNTGSVTVDGGILNIGTNNDTVGAIKLTNGSITGSTGVLTGTSYTVNNTTGTTTISAILGGTGVLTKLNAGTLILSGENTYTGVTTISGGTLRAGSSTALGTNIKGTTVNSGATLELFGDIAIGAEALTLSGNGFDSGGALRNVSGNNSYGGTVTLSGATRINSESGMLTLSGTIDGAYALNINGSGNITLGGALGNTGVLDSFTSNVATTLFINGNSVKTVGTQTYSGSTTFGAPTTLTTANRDITASGAVTATAGTLTFASGSGNVTFTNTSNNFSTVLVENASAVSLVDGNELTVSGITATGPINVATRTGNLTISGPVTTTNATPSAIIFNAGQCEVAGIATGGNIIIDGSPMITTGLGGIAAFFTGSVSESNGLTALIGSGSETSHFRYNSDESTTNYTTPLSAGKNAIYREKPTITVKAISKSIFYGEDPGTLATNTSAFQNGDTFAQAFSGSVAIAVADPKSTSGHYTAGEHTLTPSGLTSLLGYALSYSTAGTLTIDKKALTVSGITAENKIYDGNKTATIDTEDATINNIVSGDKLSLTSVTGEFDNKNIGNSKTVTLTSSYGGADKDNYDITDQTETYADITVKPLSLTGLTADNKVYDGNTDATISSYGTLTGVIGTEAVDLDTGSASAAFDNQNVGTDKTVRVISLNLNGSDSSNYSIANQTTTANITARALALTLIGLTADNKVYDGNKTATISSYGTLSGVIGSDTVGLDTGSASAAFDNKNVGTGKTVTVSNLNLNGGNSGNYSIANQTTTADITAKTLTLTGLTASNKVYNGNKTATISNYGYLTGVIGSDAVDLATGSTLAEFDTKNVGTGKTVTVSTLNLSGSDRSNYRIANQTTTMANITAKPLTISGLTAYDKNYDGNTKAMVNTSGVVFNGWISPDDLYLSATGKFSDPNIGTTKVVTLTTTYGGIDRNNYTIIDQATAIASILTAETLPPELPLVPLPPPVILGLQSPIITSALGLNVEYVAPPSDQSTGLIVVTIPQAVLTLGTTFTIPLPEEVQKVIAETGVPEAITLDGGAPLPNWLQYDPAARVFTVSGATAESLPVKVVLRIGNRIWTVEITT